MKISINSTFSYIKTNVNYGSVLQCFALQKYLKKRGHDPEHIRDYQANPILILNRLRNIRYGKRFFLKIKSLYECQKFIKNNIKLSKKGYFTLSKMKRSTPDCDCFIAGSDQIWRKANPSRFLVYAPDKAIKLSYAASFGQNKLPDDMKNMITPWIKRFDGISVREDSAVDIVNSIIGEGAIKVIDPTLLLNQDEYPYTDVNYDNYIYCYFLNLSDKKKVLFDSIIEYAKEERKELYVTSPMNYNLFTGDNLLFPSVEEWLGLYKKADCIFTNTFHGMLFCIIFKKQFLFFVQKGANSLENDRFYSLMSMLHLEDRMISNCDYNELSKKMHTAIDYNKVYDILEKERKKTDCFFSKYGI